MQKFYNLLKRIPGMLIVFGFPAFVIAQPPTIGFLAESFPGLSAPIDVVNAGDGSNRLFVAQQGGLVYVRNGATVSLFANFGPTGENIINVSGSERGLLSIAFHPGYDGTTNRSFFIYFTAIGTGDIAVRRYQTAAGNPDTTEAGSGVPIITIPHPGASNHNGGKLNFGTDGYLYFATGDGGGGDDVPNNAQNGDVLLGKMLRLNIDTTTAAYGNYGVPSTNPYLTNPDVDDRIFAIGLRNPFRWSFDRLNGNMWIGDVGQDAQEEINFRPAANTGGINYGWRCFEGYISTPDVPDCTPANYVPPVYDYPNPAGGAAAVTGGYVYRGTEFPNFRGYYVAADVYSGNLYILWPSGAGFDSSVQTGTPVSAIVGFGEGEDGTLYAVSQATNTLYKVTATGGVVLPVHLSSFYATKRNGFNEVKWKTASELNTARFYVEFSTDGRTFAKVGTVMATRNANGSEYGFNHHLTPSGDMFYRLAIEDDNGSLKYSSILRLTGVKPGSIKIYPTLIHNNSFNLEVSQAAYSLRIFNTNGKIVYKKDLQGQSGSINVYLPALSKGIYIAEVIGDGLNKKEKMIIQ